MRILVITHLFPNPYQPDRATFNRQQVRHLASRVPVAVIAPISWTVEASARRAGAPGLPRDRRAVLDGIQVEHPRFVYPPGVLRGWHGHFYKLSVQPILEQVRAGFRPDLILASWAYPDGWAAVRMGHRAGLPVVLKVHGSDLLGLGHSAARRRRTREALRGADAVVAVSRDLAREAAAMGARPEWIRVVYNGVDASAFHPGPRAEARDRLGLDRDRPFLLSVGNLVPVKGHDVLIDACAALARQGIPFDCGVIGGGGERAALEQQIERLGLQDRVRLLGPRPHDQLPDWYRAANLLVLASRSEGIPNVLLEASACGIPFVATEVGGIPEIAHCGTCQLVPPGDAGRLAEAIRDQLAAPAASSRSAVSIRGHESAAADLVDLFEQTIRGGQTGPVAEGPAAAE